MCFRELLKQKNKDIKGLVLASLEEKDHHHFPDRAYLLTVMTG
jgi:hypothetical protein